jgi:flagellar motor switch protein FliG
MASLPPSLRKAAVLISALDERAAEALLTQMGSEQSAKVRNALMELDDIPAAEQQQVLAEFMHEQGAPTADISLTTGDVELELGPHALRVASVPPPRISERQDLSSPFKFLENVPVEPLANLMRCEQPQTIAAVIANLPPQQAADVLARLPASLATDALERMAALGELAPEVFADLARGLHSQLAPHVRSGAATGLSLDRLTAVLGAMDYRQRQRVVLSLAQRNGTLLHQLGLSPPTDSPLRQASDNVVAFQFRLESDRRVAASPPAVQGSMLLEFDDLVLLDDAALGLVLAAAEPQTALLALTGADPRLVSRVLRGLPPRDAAVIRQRLEQPGPVRLREIEQAQGELAATASRLARAGTITLPRSVRFAAAV